MAMKVRQDRLPYHTNIVCEGLYPASQMLSSIITFGPQPNKAIVGANAFAHEAGIHQDGYLKERTTYEIIDPVTVGVPETRLVLGKHSGRHALKQRCEVLGFELTKEELDALRRRLFVSYYSVIPLSPLAHAQNTPSAPRFVRCVTLTEQAFGRELSALPPDADCWFENARFELTHPWKGPELDSVAALSAPARIGGHIAFALIDLTSLRDQLLAADELPADDAWEGAVSEYLTRTMSP